jgi:hypothetical protein
MEARFTAQREAEWAEFTADCGKYEAELDGEVAKGKLTLAELDEEEQSLERLRRWSRAIRARDLSGAPGAADAERRLKECTGALERFAELVYQASETAVPGEYQPPQLAILAREFRRCRHGSSPPAAVTARGGAARHGRCVNLWWGHAA